jgi:hypothetical protein
MLEQGGLSLAQGTKIFCSLNMHLSRSFGNLAHLSWNSVVVSLLP